MQTTNRIAEREDRQISRIRSLGPFSVIKMGFNRSKTRYKRIGRVNIRPCYSKVYRTCKHVRIQPMISCLAYDLYQLFTLKKKNVIA
jgi:hypothetical protein